MTVRDRLALWANWAFEGPDYRTWLIHILIAQLVSLSPFGWTAAAYYYPANEVAGALYAFRAIGSADVYMAEWGSLHFVSKVDLRLEDRIPDAMLPAGMAALMGWLLA